MNRGRLLFWPAMLGIAALWLGTTDVARAGVWLYALAACTFGLDCADLLIRLCCLRLQSTAMQPAFTAAPQPYAFVIAVHNLGREVDEFCERMEWHRERTFIVDDGSSDDTALRLRCRGWPCLQLTAPVGKPAAIRALLPRLPPAIQTVMVLDSDALPVSDADGNFHSFEQRVQTFQRSGAAAVCPRIILTPGTGMQWLQWLENTLFGQLSQVGLGQCSSVGAAALYRRDALLNAFSEHSLDTQADGLETSLLILSRGQRIYNDPRIVIAASAPARARQWLSQRASQWRGLLKVCHERRLERLDAARGGLMAFYQYRLYLPVLRGLAYPLRLAGAVLLALSLLTGCAQQLGFDDLLPLDCQIDPVLFATVYLKFAGTLLFAALLLVPARQLPRALLTLVFYPLYALIQIVPAGVGFLGWLLRTSRGSRLAGEPLEART